MLEGDNAIVSVDCYEIILIHYRYMALKKKDNQMYCVLSSGRALHYLFQFMIIQKFSKLIVINFKRIDENHIDN